MAIKYEFPCYPGDEVWFIKEVAYGPSYVTSDIVELVGFTSRSIQIKLRQHKNFNKTYTWGKCVFKTEQEAEEALRKMKEDT